MSHHLSMLSPKTPLFSFMIAMLFHHGIVAPGIRARPLMHGAQVPRLAGRQLRRAVHDQPPAGPQRAVALAKARRADRVDHDVDPLAAGDPHHLGLEVLLAVVDRVVDALLADRVVLGARRGAEDLGAAAACATWIAQMPTPPAAAWISARSPCLSPPMITSAA